MRRFKRSANLRRWRWPANRPVVLLADGSAGDKKNTATSPRRTRAWRRRSRGAPSRSSQRASPRHIQVGTPLSARPDPIMASSSPIRSALHRSARAGCLLAAAPLAPAPRRAPARAGTARRTPPASARASARAARGARSS
eukprot:570358-Pyramimonas_sp.AAC.1